MKEELEVESRNSRLEKIRTILPLLWSSYQHLYEARETATQNRINFLLVVVSFLPVICLMLCSHFENDIFLIPALFQFLALLVLLKSFFIVGRKSNKVPWLNVNISSKMLGDDTLVELENDTFDVKVFAALKASEEDTGAYLKERNKIIRLTLYLIISSILLIPLAYCFVVMKKHNMLTSFSWYACAYACEGLLILILCLYHFYKKIPQSKFDKNHKAFEMRIGEWARIRKQKQFRNSGGRVEGLGIPGT